MSENKAMKIRLEEAFERIHVPEFVNDDPVQFPRRFAAQADVEIVAFLSAIMAWGRRPMILRDCERLLELMENEPAAYVASGDWVQIPDRLNIHRTMFGEHLKYMLRGFREIMRRYGTMEAFCAAHVPAGAEDAPWRFARAWQGVLSDVNAGATCSECMPTQLDKTALKRINMALRWLVRRDSPVDMGLWKCLTPAQLYIPLDVHVGNVSRAWGLLERRSNDRRAVQLLTDRLREFDPPRPRKIRLRPLRPRRTRR